MYKINTTQEPQFGDGVKVMGPQPNHMGIEGNLKSERPVKADSNGMKSTSGDGEVKKSSESEVKKESDSEIIIDRRAILDENNNYAGVETAKKSKSAIFLSLDSSESF